MSGIYAALLKPQSSLIDSLTELSLRLSLSADSCETIALNEAGEYLKLPTGGLEWLTDNFVGLLGCAYRKPIAVEASDAGPFYNDSVAATYDGIIVGVDGQKLVTLLGEDPQDFAERVSELTGQFSLIVSYASDPRHLYYAVTARELYLLYDNRKRGIVVSSSLSALDGMYHPIREAQPVLLEPYTAGRVSIYGTKQVHSSLHRFTGEGTLILCGGGLDSVVTAYTVRELYPFDPIELAYFDYGAKANLQELDAVGQLAHQLSLGINRVDVSTHVYNAYILGHLAASSIIGADGVVNENPQAGLASEWVPARNTLLISLALAIAESRSFARIATGINWDAATAYSDNSSEWNRRMQQVVPYALGSGRRVILEAPLAEMSKADIVTFGNKLGVPWQKVSGWSCYNNGNRHCGLCSSCRARRKAFILAKVTDPTEYAQ